MKNFIEKTIRDIRETTGSYGKAVCGLSGGVDSSVAAMLVHKAIGSRLTCIFVDNGLMRKGEKEQILSIFRDKFAMKIIAVDAEKEFLDLLRGVADPEEKRKIIGNLFVRLFEREAAKIGDVDFLVQGTLRSDVIESGTAEAVVVKSHHNVGGLPEDMQLSLIEPLKKLYKDEARQVGRELGLPAEIIQRHPFPGPGLAVRILGEVTPEKLSILREADHIIIEEIKKAGLYNEIWQVFAVLPNILSVGVKDGRRTYVHTIVLRAVVSRWHDRRLVSLALRSAGAISNRLVSEIPEINRFVYDLTPKPPATIEWE